MSGLRKVIVRDGGFMNGWYGSRLDALKEVEGEVIIEDHFTGEALVLIEEHQLLMGVRHGAGGHIEYAGGLWIDLKDRPNFDLNHWITMIRMGL